MTPRIQRVFFLVLSLIAEGGIAAEEPTPTRMVSAGGAVTEILYALNAGKQVVGSDISSIWPEDVLHLPRIGYLRMLSAEGILALHPDLLVTTPEAGPNAALEHLRAAHVRIETIPGGFTADAVEKKISGVADAIHQPEQGRKLIERFKSDWQQTRMTVDHLSGRPRVLFILAHTGGSPMVAGRNTAADAMIDLARGVNAASALEGYKPLTAEAALSANPDVILVTDEGVKELGGIESLWANNAIKLTSAGKHQRAVSMDSLYLLGFGPRLPSAVRELALHLRTPKS